MKAYCHESLEELTDAQKAAFNAAESISFDLSYCWFSNLLRTALKPQEKPMIIVAEDGGGAVAVLPMCYDDSARTPRKLRALVNFYTSLYAPVTSAGAPWGLLQPALAAALGGGRRWEEVDFSPLAPEADSFAALFAALRGVGLLPFKYYCFGNWYLPVEGRSYAEYYEGLPSRLKNTVKRKGKQFFATGAARLEIVTGGERIEPAIADYLKVYASSWKVSEPFPGFIPGLIRACAELGWLRLGVAYLRDEPVAAQIWIVAHGRAAIFKLAYNEAFASYSAGSILSAHLMQHVLDVDKVSEVDYLIGDDPYKQDWMSRRRERWGIIAYNPRTLAGLAGALKQALGGWRRALLSYFNHEPA